MESHCKKKKDDITAIIFKPTTASNYDWFKQHFLYKRWHNMILIWLKWCIFDKLGPLQVTHCTFISEWANRTAVLVSKYMTKMFLGLPPLSFPARHSVWIWFHFSHFLFSITATLGIFRAIFWSKLRRRILLERRAFLWLWSELGGKKRRMGTSAPVCYLRQTAALLERQWKLCHRHLSLGSVKVAAAEDPCSSL